MAWRLLGLGPTAGVPKRPFVGRRRELRALREAFARTRADQACELVTVTGPAGIGKSRLARELAAGLRGEASVAVGRCPSYGEDVTYRPLAEIVDALGGAALLDGAPQTEELFLAVRRLLERAAPLLVVVEDIHWAEDTLLDLLEYVVALSAGAPILLVCLARPDLLERRPSWAAPRPGRTLLELDALSDAEARELVGGAAAADRIVEAAEGNPLFLEQLVAVGAEGDSLPSTIQAVLAARIAGLEPGERALLEHAAVQGRSFVAAADLLPEGDSAAALVGLVHKGLIRGERAEQPGVDAFRFAHALIREAAYRGLPKRARADIHERVARRPGTPDETAGHHLAEAYRWRAELGPADAALAAEAAGRLAAGGEAALLRGDPRAAAHLLERAAYLLGHDPAARGAVLPELGAALFEAGLMADATRVLDEAIASAPDPRLRARARIERELVRLEAESGRAAVAVRAVADDALPLLAGDEHGRCRRSLLLGQLAWHEGDVGAADTAWAEAAELARRAGRRHELFEVVGWRALAAPVGPAPVDAAISRCEDLRELVAASPLATASTLNPLALLHAMRGEHDAAEALLAQADAILAERDGLITGVSHLEALARLLGGRPDLAEASLRADLGRLGEGGSLATTTALLARAVFEQGRLDEAAELCRVTSESAAAEDTHTQALWRGVLARVLAREGHCEEAEALARGAVAVAEPTDLLTFRGDALLDLADVLRVCRRPRKADEAVRTGLALYERKGNTAAAARARALLGDRTQGGT